jgi:hypothetical protein
MIEREKLDAVSDAYHRFLASYHPKVSPIDGEDDWHLRLEWIPDGRPEVIYDLDFRASNLSITLTRFLRSAWREFWESYRVREVEVTEWQPNRARRTPEEGLWWGGHSTNARTGGIAKRLEAWGGSAGCHQDAF